MNRAWQFSIWLGVAMFLLLMLAASGAAQDAPQDAASDATMGASQPALSFREQVDLDALGNLAVQHQGRIKSLQSHAGQIMSQISGIRSYKDQPDLYTYMDIVLNPHEYDDAPIIYVKKAVRQQLADAAAGSQTLRAAPNFDERL